MNGYLCCGLPASCCQPAVAGGVIYADIRSEFSTHLALQALFTQTPVCEPLLQAFPFSNTLWEVTLHPLSQACVFIYSSRGKWVFPPLLWSFPPSATLTSFPAPGCWVRAPTPARASPARPGLFIYSSRKDPLPASSELRAPHPLCHVSLLCLLLITQFLFFSPGGGPSVQGAMLIWPRLVCGSTVYGLAHLVCIFPSCLGAGNWRPRGPPGFSV
jgi:hypothetical protein